jgi:hypothetical protein
VESNIVGDVESELKKAAGFVEKILPRDMPSDTREVAALAEEAASTVEKVDPALSPFINGLEAAFKTGVDSLQVLREKIDDLKGHAVVKAPVVEPEPVTLDPSGTIATSEALANAGLDAVHPGRPLKTAADATGQNPALSPPDPAFLAHLNA